MTKTKNAVPSSDTVSHAAQATRTLSTYPVGPDLAYFRLVHMVEFAKGAAPDNLRAHFSETVSCGFARPRAIFSFADDKAGALKPLQKLRVAPAGFREVARTKGFMAAFDQFQKAFQGEQDLMDKFLAGEIDLDDIVYLDIGSHMLFDRNNEVLPTGIYFDYTNGNLRNGSYHLDKALAVLSKDARITPHVDTRSRSRKSGQDPVLAITEVESFNADSANIETIAFWFAPTDDDMRSIWAKAQSYGSQHPSTDLRQAIFDLDVMGLRAAGAAKYEHYYGVDETVAEASDD